jgi:DNA polymerase-3 subunit delta
MGEEPYYIDRITEYLEQNVLQEHEREFNQMVLYGKDVSVDDIVSQAKRFPMMADYQVIIVREAQELSRTIEQLISYVQQPQQTTILVFNYKYKKLDKRKALAKAIAKSGVLFESKILYDNQVPEWIRRVLAGQNYSITPKAAEMLLEYLGTNLSKISNELNKLKIVLPEGTQINAEHIEQNIGISKDFNNFELRDAIGSKNSFKAYQIAKYFAENPKDNPLVVTITLLYSYFVQLLKIHGLNDKSPRAISSALGIPGYYVNGYIVAIRNYPMKKVSMIIELLHEYDVKSKGVGSKNMSNDQLLKELLVRILN